MMTESSLICPHGSITVITLHKIWNFKSKGKPHLWSFSEKLKKEATQPALVSTRFVCFCCLQDRAWWQAGHVSSRDGGMCMAAGHILVSSQSCAVWPTLTSCLHEELRGVWRGSSVCVPAIHHNTVPIKCQTQSPSP